MPWVSRTRTSGNRIYWITSGVASVLFGVLVGYALWGQSASMATNVEHELKNSEIRLKNLETRLQVLDLQNGIGSANGSPESAGSR